MLHSHYDVVIVGARLAGAATATFLASAGLRVLLLDKAPPGTDTLSTHALLRTGVLQLARLGVLSRLQKTSAPPITETTFSYNGEATTIPIVADDFVPHLLAPRRYTLDTALTDTAAEAGADVQFGLRAVGLHRGRKNRVTGLYVRRGAQQESQLITADLVVGADGVRSQVAASLGSESPIWKVSKHHAATVYGYFPVTGNSYQWLFDAPRNGRSGRAAGIIPTEDGRSCIFLSSTPEEFVKTHRRQPLTSLREGLERMGHERMPQVRLESHSPLRYFAGAPGHIRRCVGPGWALVGDAGYFKDPATAHGMSDALRDAELLTRAVLIGSDEALSAYETERDELSIEFFDLSDKIASFQLQHDELRGVHRQLSREMNKELRRLLELSPLPIARRAA